MPATDPVASVCIPTYNRTQMLQRAVASAQTQTESRIEIVICDNASTDGTPEYAGLLVKKDPRVRYVSNVKNLGMVGNWNRCLAEASAPLICLLNDDDTLSPQAVEVGCDLLKRHPEVQIAFGASRHCRESGKLMRINRPFTEERVLLPVEAHRTIWLRNCFQLTHAIFRTEAARNVAGFSPEVGWNTDTDFMLRLTARGGAAVTPAETGTYYVHTGQLTGTSNKEVFRDMVRMVERVMEEVSDKPELAALRPLAESEYLSRYTIHFAAAALKRGRRKEAMEFLAQAWVLGLPSSRKHVAMYGILRVSLAVPGGAVAFKSFLAPVLSKVASRYS